MKKNIKNLIKKLFKTGFFSIYLSIIFSKFITLGCGVLLVRIMSQEDYGSYSLILNAFSILYILGDFGASGASFQLATENHNDEKKQITFLKFGLKSSVFASAFSGLLILCSRFYYPFYSKQIANYTYILFLIPFLMNGINFVNIFLRIKQKNNKYSIYQFFSTFIHYIVIIPMAVMFGLLGAISSQYLYNILILLLGIFIVRKSAVFKKTHYQLQKSDKKIFYKLAVGTQINSTLINVFNYINIFLLGVMMVNPKSIAIYKVATVIPLSLIFLPQCFSIYILPFYIKNNKNKKWLNKNIKRIFLISSIVYTFIALILMLFSNTIIQLLYGIEYIDAVLPFNILLLGFVFNSAIKIPFSDIMFAMKKVKVNVIISLTTSIISIFLNIIFIKNHGYAGAAIATTVTIIIQSLIYFIYMKKILKYDGGSLK